MYIGVMSGTSLDGIDFVAVSFDPLALHASQTVPFPEELREDLLALTFPDDNEIERMGVADVALGRLVGESINQLIHDHQLNKADIRAIGSHGQTIRHRPESGFSLQIGDPNLIAEITGLPVIADFRRRDMAAGGQGAPLVPAFHQAMFQHPTINRIILNLGGIANISVLPAGQPDAVYGFDTGPANVLMDAWCFQHTGQIYDHDGLWAAAGTVHKPLLTQLLSHEYFSRPHPKSTGREDFNLEWLQQQISDVMAIDFHEDSYGSFEYHDLNNAPPQDIQATLLKLTARSVADAIEQTNLGGGEVWLCGGGAYNHTLWQTLAEWLPEWTLKSTKELGLAPTWVEATAFAWLARQRIEGLPGNLPAVTGATGYRVLGGRW
ncbi:anhydro-N-acetylmuramic acid kinase [Aquirhabdus parva]|uniref:Anhydro-N-acetylmuramic acid kinase n=2 Tax=Aquirhabdus parva TaxID=2283318 RepID=A0A345PAI5_9GAMM|nr:anhydro-N-acetylmuramic acid kinase [Aquirhabdus parva]